MRKALPQAHIIFDISIFSVSDRKQTKQLTNTKAITPTGLISYSCTIFQQQISAIAIQTAVAINSLLNDNLDAADALESAEQVIKSQLP